MQNCVSRRPGKRTPRYEQPGSIRRGLRDIPFALDRDLPTFVLSPVEIGKEPFAQGFTASLPEFVAGMLTKRLQWEIPEQNKAVHVEVAEDGRR